MSTRRDILAGALAMSAAPALAAALPGWTSTRGGAGGRVLRVTTLASDGPGSLREALRTKGPRTVVFAVGGVIDLGGQSLKVSEPFLTLDGESAPSPGVTLIRGGLTIATHDVVVRHVRVRPGTAGRAKGSGWECDSLSVERGRDVVIDHCSASWGTDENLSVSGPRFEGQGVEGWRKATSHRVTVTNCLIAEGLSNATHSKGEHSKGSLAHDNVTDVLFAGNLWAHNRERSPLFKGGARGCVVNNLIYDPGKRAVHFNLHAAEWDGHAYEAAQLALVGNVVRAGPSSDAALAVMMVGGQGPIDLFMADNLGFDRAGGPLPQIGRFGGSTIEPRMLARPAVWPAGLKAAPAAGVEAAVLASAGARPWERDAVDRRIVAQVREHGGRIIDSEAEVGGYPR